MCYRPTDCPSPFPQHGLNRSCREHANITTCPLLLVNRYCSYVSFSVVFRLQCWLMEMAKAASVQHLSSPLPHIHTGL